MFFRCRDGGGFAKLLVNKVGWIEDFVPLWNARHTVFECRNAFNVTYNLTLFVKTNSSDHTQTFSHSWCFLLDSLFTPLCCAELQDRACLIKVNRQPLNSKTFALWCIGGSIPTKSWRRIVFSKHYNDSALGAPPDVNRLQPAAKAVWVSRSWVGWFLLKLPYM